MHCEGTSAARALCCRQSATGRPGPLDSDQTNVYSDDFYWHMNTKLYARWASRGHGRWCARSSFHSHMDAQTQLKYYFVVSSFMFSAFFFILLMLLFSICVFGAHFIAIFRPLHKAIRNTVCVSVCSRSYQMITIYRNKMLCIQAQQKKMNGKKCEYNDAEDEWR